MAYGEITTAYIHDIGAVRSNQEDSFLCWVAPGGEAASGLRAVLAVADGMGGHQAGEVASSLAIDHLRRYLTDYAQDLEFTGPEDVRAYLVDLVNDAHDKILQLPAEQPEHRPGTTLTVVAVWRDQAVVCHVGDSRCYRLRGARAVRLTNDHTYASEQVQRGTLTDEEAARSPLRNRLTRCLGVDANAQCDTVIVPLAPGDLLALSTDGLHGIVPERDILSAMASRPLAEATEELLQRALSAGGQDNITLLLAQIGSRVLLARDTVPDLVHEMRTRPGAALAGQPDQPVGLDLRKSLLIGVAALFVLIIGAKMFRGEPEPAAPPPVTPISATAPTAAPTAPREAIVTFTADNRDIVIQPETPGVTVEGAGNYTVSQPAVGTFRVTLRNAAAGQAYALDPADGPASAQTSELTAEPSEGRFSLPEGQHILRLGRTTKVTVATVTVGPVTDAAATPAPAAGPTTPTVAPTTATAASAAGASVLWLSADGRDLVVGAPEANIVVTGAEGYKVTSSSREAQRITLNNTASGQAFTVRPAGGGDTLGQGALPGEGPAAEVRVTPGDYELRVGTGIGKIVGTLTVRGADTPAPAAPTP